MTLEEILIEIDKIAERNGWKKRDVLHEFLGLQEKIMESELKRRENLAGKKTN